MVMKRLFFNLFAALGILVSIIMATPFVAWYGKILSGPFNNPQGKTLIVLGANQSGEGLIGKDTYWRVVYALRAYRQGEVQKIILSGKEVAASMALFLHSQGVPPEIIFQEPRSLTTRENALFVKSLLGPSSNPVVLMTSDYHMFRARRVFARCGVVVLPRPVPDAIKQAGRWTERWSVFTTEAVETIKIAYYFAHGWI
jgi:uncharacterized SAM-binding protein YcdF (DUF218 family)